MRVKGNNTFEMIMYKIRYVYCFNCKVFISQENGLSNYKIGNHFLLILYICDISWEEFWKDPI